MSKPKSHNIQDTKSSLQIRVEFKECFGIDLNEADEIIKERKAETERHWHQTLVSNGMK
jgi:hypothetical protein